MVLKLNECYELKMRQNQTKDRKRHADKERKYQEIDMDNSLYSSLSLTWLQRSNLYIIISFLSRDVCYKLPNVERDTCAFQFSTTNKENKMETYSEKDKMNNQFAKMIWIFFNEFIKFLAVLKGQQTVQFWQIHWTHVCTPHTLTFAQICFVRMFGHLNVREMNIINHRFDANQN